MKDFKVIEVKRSIFEDNNADADRLREQLKSEGTFLLNLMSSPGAGKTTTLKRTINMLKDEINIGVMEADIDSDVDAQAITDTGVRAIQIHTCLLYTSAMQRRAKSSLPLQLFTKI